MSGKTQEQENENLITELINLPDNQLMAIERSFVTAIIMNVDYLKSNAHKSMSADLVEIYQDNINRRRAILKRINDELISRTEKQLLHNCLAPLHIFSTENNPSFFILIPPDESIRSAQF